MPLAALLAAHVACAEWMASTPEETGGERLWAGEAGNQLAAFIAELMEHGDLLDEIDPVSYPGLFETLLADASYWPRFGLHPRLHILSPIEARLQRFDKVMLGGLNEGTWPADAAPDPWMSRPMRVRFGLPATERAIGQSAHDFYLFCASPEVILSRARKVEGAPTVPSRWLVRLETLVTGLDKAIYERMQAQRLLRAGQGVYSIPPWGIPPLKPPEPDRRRLQRGRGSCALLPSTIGCVIHTWFTRSIF